MDESGPFVWETETFLKSFLRDRGLSWEETVSLPLAGDGSMRFFWRILSRTPGFSCILMTNPPKDDLSRRENLAYLKIGCHLFQKEVPVPEIYRFDLDKGWFILEDKGAISLQDRAKSDKARVQLYKRVVEVLLHQQLFGAKGFDRAWTCQTEEYDRVVMRRYESGYFRDAFLKGYLGLEKDWAYLEGSFDHLAEEAAKACPRFFLHRDFQSRNIMITGDRIGIIDWQGGRLGPLGYDLASLLIDPYVDLSDEEKAEVFEYYLGILRSEQPDETEIFLRTYPYLAIQRNLQIIGAFSFLTKVRGKTSFERYLSPALCSLRHLLKELEDPKLRRLRELADTLKSAPIESVELS